MPRLLGRLCEVGQYCQGGVAIDCGLGKYCPEEQLTVDGSNCDAGFYCEGKAMNRRPSTYIDDPTASRIYNGDRCESGQFCEEGVSAGTNCAEGTFSSARGLREQAECSKCPNGYECNTSGMEFADVLAATCSAGQFCAAGIDGTTVTPQDCGYGKKCPSGTVNMEEIPCDSGYYNGALQAQSCSGCDLGSYCPYMWDVSSNGNTQLTDCPAGHECTTSLLDSPTPCPPGKF